MSNCSQETTCSSIAVRNRNARRRNHDQREDQHGQRDDQRGEKGAKFETKRVMIAFSFLSLRALWGRVWGTTPAPQTQAEDFEKRYRCESMLGQGPDLSGQMSEEARNARMG